MPAVNRRPSTATRQLQEREQQQQQHQERTRNAKQRTAWCKLQAVSCSLPTRRSNKGGVFPRLERGIPPIASKNRATNNQNAKQRTAPAKKQQGTSCEKTKDVSRQARERRPTRQGDTKKGSAKGTGGWCVKTRARTDKQPDKSKKNAEQRRSKELQKTRKAECKAKGKAAVGGKPTKCRAKGKQKKRQVKNCHPPTAASKKKASASASCGPFA